MYRPEKFDPPWVDFFKRPCPAYVRHYGNFQLFPKLPKELQLMIWSEAIPSPQDISIRSNKDIDVRKDHLLVYQTPGILHACFDSRKEGLRHYQPIFEWYLRHPIYMDLDRDFLILDSAILKTIQYLAPNRNFPELEMNLIRRLILEVDEIMSNERKIISLSCRFFTGLELLIIKIPDCVLHRHSPRLPYCMESEEFLVRGNRSVVRGVMNPIPFVRGTLASWVPPRTIIGRCMDFKKVNMMLLLQERAHRNGSMDWTRTFAVPTFNYSPMYSHSLSSPSFYLEINERKDFATSGGDMTSEALLSYGNGD